MPTLVATNATAADRAARGRQARATVPRSSHAHLGSAADRPDPIELLREQAESRVTELVPILRPDGELASCGTARARSTSP